MSLDGLEKGYPPLSDPDQGARKGPPHPTAPPLPLPYHASAPHPGHKSALMGDTPIRADLCSRKDIRLCQTPTRATARAHPTPLHHPCPYHTTHRLPTLAISPRLWGTPQTPAGRLRPLNPRKSVRERAPFHLVPLHVAWPLAPLPRLWRRDLVVGRSSHERAAQAIPPSVSAGRRRGSRLFQAL